MDNFLGLDLSLTRMGWAVYTPERNRQVRVEHVPTPYRASRRDGPYQTQYCMALGSKDFQGGEHFILTRDQDWHNQAIQPAEELQMFDA